MREVSFVKKLKFNFNGSVTKKALVIGDADNDQRNELVCANLQGDLAVFKDSYANKFAYASDLGMITACLIGDVINTSRNHIAAINTEGWLSIFDLSTAPHDKTLTPPRACQTENQFDMFGSTPIPLDPSISCIANEPSRTSHDTTANNGHNPSCNNNNASRHPIPLNLIYDQRMPANCKELLVADLDGDGQNELIVGLTDRVLRTYKWIKIGAGDLGKFVGLYKWEFADQIGAVSLNPSCQESAQDIIVAQPGGTYAKLECFKKQPSRSTSVFDSISAKLSSDTSLARRQTSDSDETSSAPTLRKNDSLNTAESGTQSSDDNIKTEYISKLTPEYHQLALSSMRNGHISTEVLGGIRNSANSNTYTLIVVATLDGTLMIVDKDEILWSLQVDHQLFALASFEANTDVPQGYRRVNLNKHTNLSQSESTCTIVPNTGYLIDDQDPSSESSSRRRSSDGIPRPMQYFAVCAWNGKTYIVDEDRNYMRFKFDEAVSAFTAGTYHADNLDYPCLVYATFNNQIELYFDVLRDQIRPLYLLQEIMDGPANLDLLEKLEIIYEKFYDGGETKSTLSPDVTNTKKSSNISEDDRQRASESSQRATKMNRIRQVLRDILYNTNELKIV